MFVWWDPSSFIGLSFWVLMISGHSFSHFYSIPFLIIFLSFLFTWTDISTHKASNSACHCRIRRQNLHLFPLDFECNYSIFGCVRNFTMDPPTEMVSFDFHCGLYLLVEVFPFTCVYVPFRRLFPSFLEGRVDASRIEISFCELQLKKIFEKQKSCKFSVLFMLLLREKKKYTKMKSFLLSNSRKWE